MNASRLFINKRSPYAGVWISVLVGSRPDGYSQGRTFWSASRSLACTCSCARRVAACFISAGSSSVCFLATRRFLKFCTGVNASTKLSVLMRGADGVNEVGCCGSYSLHQASRYALPTQGDSRISVRNNKLITKFFFWPTARGQKREPHRPWPGFPPEHIGKQRQLEKERMQPRS